MFGVFLATLQLQYYLKDQGVTQSKEKHKPSGPLQLQQTRVRVGTISINKKVRRINVTALYMCSINHNHTYKGKILMWSN